MQRENARTRAPTSVHIARYMGIAKKRATAKENRIFVASEVNNNNNNRDNPTASPRDFLITPPLNDHREDPLGALSK